MEKYVIDNPVIMYINDEGHRYIRAEFMINDFCHRIYFDIEENNINEKFQVNVDNPNMGNVSYNSHNDNNSTIKDNILNLDFKLDITLEDNYEMVITIKKEIDLEKDVLNSLFDIIDTFPPELVIYYIRKIIETGELYNKREFIIKYMDTIKEIIKDIESKKIGFKKANLNDVINLDDTIYIVQEYLNKYGYEFNVKEAIESGLIQFEKQEEATYGNDGRCGYDKKNKTYYIKSVFDKTIKSPLILLHEIMHYLNEVPEGERNETSHFLTEVVSYTNELILAYELYMGNYKDEIAELISVYANSIDIINDKLYDPLYSIYIYKRDHKLNEDSFKSREGFEKYVNDFIPLLKTKNVIDSEVWTLIGYYLSIYNIVEILKDESFKDRIFELHNSINTKSFEDCLKIIGFNSLDEIVPKCSKNLDVFIDTIYKMKRMKEEKVNHE